MYQCNNSGSLIDSIELPLDARALLRPVTPQTTDRVSQSVLPSALHFPVQSLQGSLQTSAGWRWRGSRRHLQWEKEEEEGCTIANKGSEITGCVAHSLPHVLRSPHHGLLGVLRHAAHLLTGGAEDGLDGVLLGLLLARLQAGDLLLGDDWLWLMLTTAGSGGCA